MTAFETAAATANGVQEAVLATAQPQLSQSLGVQELGAKEFVDESIAGAVESIRVVNQRVSHHTG